MSDINVYIQSLGLTAKESHIYVTLYTLGSHPASTIASVAGCERVWTYKTLLKMVDMGIVAQTVSKDVKHFWIPSIDLIQTYIQSKKNTWQTLDTSYDVFKSQIVHLSQKTNASMPTIQLYENAVGIKHICDDMLSSITSQKLLTISLFATNTFDEQLQSKHKTHKYLADFWETLQSRKTTITSHIGQGSMIMERIQSHTGIAGLNDLPAGGSAVNIFLIGQEVFIIIYKKKPIGIRLSSPELAWAMHFLLDMTIKS